MGMTPDHLIAYAGKNIGHGKLVKAFPERRVKKHLKQYVSELFCEMVGILFVDRIDRFPGLLYHIGPKSFMCLLPVPRTAVRSSESAHDLCQIIKRMSVAMQIINTGNIYRRCVIVSGLSIQLIQRNFFKLSESAF